MEGRQSRPGLLGRYYAARHTTEQYLSFSVTGSYILRHSPLDTIDERLKFLLSWALHRTIQRHPILSYSLTDKNVTEEAHFTRLLVIQWSDVVEFHKAEKRNPEDVEDSALAQVLGKAHQSHFTGHHQQPVWKIHVVFPEDYNSEGTRIDIVFLCHHGIGDGTSGAAFHKTLFQNLDIASRQTILDSSWPYVVPNDTPLPIFVEEAFPFPSNVQSSPSESQKSNWNPKPQPYTFEPPLSLQSPTIIRILSLPSSVLPPLMIYCRSRKLTLTAFLHSLITIYLSRTVPSAQAFRSVTPYSMRRFTGTPTSEIVCHVSYITTLWNNDIITSARACQPYSPAEAEVIAKIASQYKDEITAELASIPVSGPTALQAISKIPDMHALCHDIKSRGIRDYTYELSNVGSVEVPAPKDGQVELQKLVFAQCGMPVGPAFGCSVVSVQGGILSLSLHWQEGVVDVNVMEGLRDYLNERLSSFANQKEFLVDDS